MNKLDGVCYRGATIKDVYFIVDAIVEAEKSGTDRLSYSAIFGLTEEEVRRYLAIMLSEEIDGCGELSISNYLLAEKGNQLIAASCAWVEGAEGMPTAVLKGNLLIFSLPEKVIERTIRLQKIFHELHFDYKNGAAFMGAGYVVKEFRGNNLLMILKDKQLNYFRTNPDISEAYVDTFSCSKAALRTNEKLGFQVLRIKESNTTEILNYLPSNKKLLLRKVLEKHL